MATGDRVLEALRIVPPATLAAPPDTFAGGSTPAETFVAYSFSETTGQQRYLDITFRLSADYDGGGLQVRLPWRSTATSGSVRWRAAIRALPDDSEVWTASHTYDYNGVTDAAPAAGQSTEAMIAFTHGADMDNLAAGQKGVLRVGRDPDHADDGMAAAALLLADLLYALEA